MPQLRSRQLQQRQSREGCPDEALLDEPACRLKPRAQESIWRAADESSSFLGFTEQASAADAIEGQRFLVPDVLASADHLTGDIGMSRRDGEVDDDLDIWVVENGSDVSSCGNLVLGRLFLSCRLDDVANRQHVGVGKVGEILQVGIANSAGPDHADANRPTHDQARSASRNSRLARTASSKSDSESSNSTTRNASRAAAMMSCTGSTPDPTATCFFVSRLPSPSFRCSATTRSPSRLSSAGTSAPPAYAQ